jgi:tetrahydromethanopterin S-methyltransferase subunit G
MVVMTPREPRETWTDERLDDLNKKVDDGFERVERRFAEAKAETEERFREVDQRFNRLELRMDNGFAQLNDRFDRLQLALFRGTVAVAIALIGSTATLAGIALL